MTLPYPSSGPTSAWKKLWRWDLSLWSSFDISRWSSRSGLAVTHCPHSRSLQQRETRQHWTAEAGQAPAMATTLENRLFYFEILKGSHLSPAGQHGGLLAVLGGLQGAVGHSLPWHLPRGLWNNREMFLQEQEMKDLLSPKHCWWPAHAGNFTGSGTGPCFTSWQGGSEHQSDSVSRGRTLSLPWGQLPLPQRGWQGLQERLGVVAVAREKPSWSGVPGSSPTELGRVWRMLR